MTEPRCPLLYQLDWDNRVQCGLLVRHKGPCGPSQPLPQPPPLKPHHYQQTSRMAVRSLSSEVTGEINREIIHHLQEHPYTTDEIEVLTSRPHQTISAAISHLWHGLNVIRPMLDRDGQRVRRRTRSGRWADVYELVP